MLASQDITSNQGLKLNCHSIFKSVFTRLAQLKFRASGQDIAVMNKKRRLDMFRFEISSDKLNELLLKREICAADIRCLDANSKQCLKKLCLKTCLRSTSLYSDSRQYTRMERDKPAVIKQQHMILEPELASINKANSLVY
jgi:hypothetical protein